MFVPQGCATQLVPEPHRCSLLVISRSMLVSR
jgi:hypothetical protein